ncbi:hypothetical protein PILCRDRAFT_618241 [Piloderma croceum F 1598]|uniref:non-specific serine/threonine protein kinase n=1 Tax=Piloderma croceum (strain F 1598) TaxID=765440 RepID=A0A0C3FCM5_PILCF|nr:hypothetical protein PILCRDRAFT_618241 [Piloderma croceum F 1598]
MDRTHFADEIQTWQCRCPEAILPHRADHRTDGRDTQIYRLCCPILLGELWHINKLRNWPLDCVLHGKYHFPKEADTTASFLTPMLCLHPDRRAKASEFVHYNRLDCVLVRGDINLIHQGGRGCGEKETK